ncbi:hypothetical protein ACQKWADRAFT_313882 [Trichoderma austrokoningii]
MIQVVVPENTSVDSETFPGAQLQVIRRAADPSVVATISATLSKPIKSKFDFFVVCAALDDIVSHLPLATLALYRPALQTLSCADGAPSPEGVSVPCLAGRARDALRFIDDPGLAWAPQHKFDGLAIRSLAERIDTAAQMEPFKQLARWPELTIDPIKEVILKNRNDPGWLLHILGFVEQYVPVGALWEKLEPELVQLAGSEAEDEEGVELPEAARRMLRLLKEAGETDAS